MNPHRPILIGWFLATGFALNAGCGRQAAPPTVVGPKTVLFRTPQSSGRTSFQTSVAFAPDGATVAASRIEPSGLVVSLYDVASGRERASLKGPFGEDCHLAFSPDGRTLAVGQTHAVTLHDPQTGRVRSELTGVNAYGPCGLAYTADGRRLATSTVLGDLALWDLEPQRVIRVMKSGTRSVGGVAVSPDGKWVASATAGPITCIPISYGLFGRGVACGRDGGRVRLFDAATGKLRATLKHNRNAYSAAFSPDGKVLASGGGDAAKLWDLTTNKVRTAIKVGDELEVDCVAFSPDGATLAVGVGSRAFDGTYGEVRLWDMGLGRVRAVLRGEPGKVRSLAFAPDGGSLVTGSNRGAVLWDLPPKPDGDGKEESLGTPRIGSASSARRPG